MDLFIPLEDWINVAFDKVNHVISPILRATSVYLESFINMFENVLTWPLPSFVYLIPAVMFFGMGKVAALFATLIFAMPPAVRMTNLGIRSVSLEMVEVATAFGSTRRQTLYTAVQCGLVKERNKKLSTFYDRKRNEGKPHKVAVIACANKLFHWIHAMLKRQEDIVDLV